MHETEFLEVKLFNEVHSKLVGRQVPPQDSKARNLVDFLTLSPQKLSPEEGLLLLQGEFSSRVQARLPCNEEMEAGGSGLALGFPMSYLCNHFGRVLLNVLSLTLLVLLPSLTADDCPLFHAFLPVIFFLSATS